jgi:hypothetical protein
MRAHNHRIVVASDLRRRVDEGDGSTKDGRIGLVELTRWLYLSRSLLR